MTRSRGQSQETQPHLEPRSAVASPHLASRSPLLGPALVLVGRLLPAPTFPLLPAPCLGASKLPAGLEPAPLGPLPAPPNLAQVSKSLEVAGPWRDVGPSSLVGFGAQGRGARGKEQSREAVTSPGRYPRLPRAPCGGSSQQSWRTPRGWGGFGPVG